MFLALQVLALLLVAVAMALRLGHALELPGRRRLSKETYAAVQPIYYPGFTIGGGVGEFGGLLATLLLVLVTPRGSAAFWPSLAAFLALCAMHGVYWLLTHPVNRFWLKDFQAGAAGRRFFGLGRPVSGQTADWTVLRDRWEHSHVIRAALALVSLALLAAAIALPGQP